MNIVINQAYNNWTPIRHAPEQGPSKYLCRCVCGTERFVMKYNLGKVKGCGCDREYTGLHGKGGSHYRQPTKKASVAPKVVRRPPSETMRSRSELVIKESYPKPLNIRISEKDMARGAARRKSEELLEDMRLERELSYL